MGMKQAELAQSQSERTDKQMQVVECAAYLGGFALQSEPALEPADKRDRQKLGESSCQPSERESARRLGPKAVCFAHTRLSI